MITQITPPRVAFLDPRTGAVSREWYLFFLSLYNFVDVGEADINGLLQAPVATFEASSIESRLSFLETAPRVELQESGDALTLATVEVNVGSVPKTGGHFTIAGSGLTVDRPVLINQAVGPYTGKGTLADEAEMDQVNVTASVTDAATITAYWSSARRVKGNFKFNYQVSA